jgi:hypothetical protein
MTGEHFLEGVKRAGADIPINHAHRGDEQAHSRGFGMGFFMGRDRCFAHG